MTFSFSATPDFDFLAQFAQQIQTPINDGLMLIPEWLGKGYIHKLKFSTDFKLVIHHYVLKEELTIKRNSVGDGNDLVTMFFYNNEKPVQIAYNNDPYIRVSQRDGSSIQITSNDLSSSISFPAYHHINYVVVGVQTSRLKSLLSVDMPNTVIETITSSGNSFLYFEGMNAETKQLLENIVRVNIGDPLSGFYLQIKVQQLIYLLIHKLSLRDSAAFHTMNSADAEKLLQVRNKITSDLSAPPVIRELAQGAAMSETKLKQLFKQTFGSTIYNYYQQARMEEAAFLLKQGKHSVAEVGYGLGFSNLSHFSRLFKKHYGLNPKRFSHA